jgi:hypothetical protein
MANGDAMVMNAVLPNCEPYLLAAAVKATLRAREVPLIPFNLYGYVFLFLTFPRRAVAARCPPLPAIYIFF